VASPWLYPGSDGPDVDPLPEVSAAAFSLGGFGGVLVGSAAVAVTGASSTTPKSEDNSLVEAVAREVAIDPALTAEGATRIDAATRTLAADTANVMSAGETAEPGVRLSLAASLTLNRSPSKRSTVPAMVNVAVTRGHVCSGGGGGRGGDGGGEGEGGDGDGGGGGKLGGGCGGPPGGSGGGDGPTVCAGESTRELPKKKGTTHARIRQSQLPELGGAKIMCVRGVRSACKNSSREVHVMLRS
jgi:hypothetical protein